MLDLSLLFPKFINKAIKFDRILQKLMLSTTKILTQIEEDLKRSKSLEGYLPSLITSLQSQKKMVFNNMNAKQKLTQLQYLIQAQVNKINQSLTENNIDLEEIEDQSLQSEKQQQNQQASDLDQQQNQEDDKFEEEDEFEQEMENQDEQEFVEPEFETEKIKKKNKKHADIDEMIPEEQQNKQDYENQDQDQQVEGQEHQLQAEQDDEAQGSDDDVGLYGEQLHENDEDIEDYENQFDEQEFKEFEQEFGDAKDKSKKDKKKLNEEQGDNPDDHIEDQFDHFRQVELENQKKQVQQPIPKTQMDNQIDRLQGKIFGKKQWATKGQIKARQRPANSLLEYDLQFNSGIKYSHEITQEKNTELEELIKKRVLNDMFDDRTRFINTSHIREHFGSLKEVSREKNQMGLGELYQSQFKNFLGIGQNKNEKLKSEIMDSFKELNYYLDSLSNFSFVPKPSKQNTRRGQSEAIIVEEKVPLTLWNGQKQASKEGKFAFESQKQVDNQAKRLKNKRIARQRKKEQTKKKLNKVIQYGGITKFEAQAKKKAQMNNKPLKIDGVNMKYNKSSSFFKNINERKTGKPNPDISKMKI